MMDAVKLGYPALPAVCISGGVTRIGSDEPRSIAPLHDVGTTCRKYEEISRAGEPNLGETRVSRHRLFFPKSEKDLSDERQPRGLSLSLSLSLYRKKRELRLAFATETTLQRSGTISPKEEGTLSTQGRLQTSNGPRLPLREPRAGIASGDGRPTRIVVRQCLWTTSPSLLRHFKRVPSGAIPR